MQESESRSLLHHTVFSNARVRVRMFSDMRSPHRVVILGAGFGGIQTYLSLRKHARRHNLKITLINKTNYFLFTPLLHEVATGGLGEHNAVESVREIIGKDPASFLMAAATEVDLAKRMVKTSVGDVSYDTLVIATGAETNYYGIPGAEKYGIVLKTLADAIAIKQRLVDLFEKASRATDAAERKKLLSFVVVGGGPTGVETATEMAELFRETFRLFYDTEISSKDVSLTLISADPDLLMPFHPTLRKKALNALERQGITVKLKTLVKEVTPEGLRCDNGDLLSAQMVIWAAGVRPITPTMPAGTECERGRLSVDEFLRLAGRERVFALGDTACAHGPDGKPIPMLAQVAVRQGPIVATNIVRSLQKRPLKPYVFSLKGTLVSLGRFKAAAQIGPFHLSGPVAWFMWRTVYFFNFHSWSKRLKIGVDWFVNLFFPRDITRA